MIPNFSVRCHLELNVYFWDLFCLFGSFLFSWFWNFYYNVMRIDLLINLGHLFLQLFTSNLFGFLNNVIFWKFFLNELVINFNDWLLDFYDGSGHDAIFNDFNHFFDVWSNDLLLLNYNLGCGLCLDFYGSLGRHF